MNNLISGKDYVINNNVLIIKEGITYIPKKSFDFNRNIHKVIFPSSLICIGDNAFGGSGLTGELIIPDSVKYIMAGAFNACNINKLILGRNLKFIGTSAFSWCQLTEVINNSSKLRYINGAAFLNNGKLKQFEFNNTNRPCYMCESVFRGSGVKINSFNSNKVQIFNIYDNEGINHFPLVKNTCDYKTVGKYSYENNVLIINDGVEIIGNFSALKDCEKVILPDSVEIILPNTFLNLTKLKEVVFSNNIIAIMDGAFFGCNFKNVEIKIPNSLCLIANEAFDFDDKHHILIPDNVSLYYENNNFNMSTSYKLYLNDYSSTEKKSNKIINIADLLENDRIKLESLGLLPDTIVKNKEMNIFVTEKQSNLMKKAIIEYIIDSDYNEKNDLTNLKKLLDMKFIDINDTGDIIKYLFDREQINTIYLFMSYGFDYMSDSMISRAAIYDMYDLIDTLLIWGVDIDEIGTIETTPLSTACILGNYNMVKYLIEKGAAINKVDSHNKMAIDYALEKGYLYIVDLINSYSKEKTEAESDLEVINKRLRLGE